MRRKPLGCLGLGLNLFSQVAKTPIFKNNLFLLIYVKGESNVRDR